MSRTTSNHQPETTFVADGGGLPSSTAHSPHPEMRGEVYPAISHPQISTEDPSYRKRIRVLDTNMAYVDVGEGDPIVFLHGNPTPSYLWRNIIPYLLPLGRCLAPDYVGMGNSGAAPNGSYRFVDHQRYLDDWFEKLDLKKSVILVVHDLGSALGFSWAQRHPERIRALIYMECIVRPFLSWDEWPETTRQFFKAQRAPAGEEPILEKNLFIEYLLPLRNMPKEAMEVYRRYYRNPGPSRLPILTWTRELPIEGKPEDVTQIVDSYARWPSKSPIPGGVPDQPATGILSVLAESADGYRKGSALCAGGIAG